jgi:hypothetical protein
MGNFGHNNLKESIMDTKLKALFILVLFGLLLGISPVTQLYSADDNHTHSSNQDDIANASIQFILVYIESETLEELMDESNVPTLDSILLEKIGQRIHAEDGAEIVSQAKLTVIGGYEAEMTVVENEKRKAKNPDEGNGEQAQRETEMFVWIAVEIHDENQLFARFTYKRSVVEEAYSMGKNEEEEEGIEQKFELSSSIVLHTGQAGIAGANLNEDMVALLIMKADL